jgi:hypothetical protein
MGLFGKKKSVPMDTASNPDAPNITPKSNSAISRCVLDDNIHKKNVISKTYVVPQKNIPEAIKDFMGRIVELNNTPAGLPFFIMQIMDNNLIKIRLYLSIEQDTPNLPKGMQFDSYFCVEPMAALCVSRDPDKNMSEAYVVLYNFLQENKLKATTPIFQILGGDSRMQYTFLKVGYSTLN